MMESGLVSTSDSSFTTLTGSYLARDLSKWCTMYLQKHFFIVFYSSSCNVLSKLSLQLFSLLSYSRTTTLQ